MFRSNGNTFIFYNRKFDVIIPERKNRRDEQVLILCMSVVCTAHYDGSKIDGDSRTGVPECIHKILC